MLLPYALLLGLTTASDNEPELRRFGSDFTESAVLVDHSALAHTTQLLARDGHRTSASDELQDVLQQLQDTLAEFGSSRATLVKLNIYVVDAATHALVLDHLASWCPARAKPAVASVTTPLPDGRRVAIDCVFVARNVGDTSRVVHQLAGRRSLATVLPKGDVVYVSGQAQPGSLAEATTATLKAIVETLRFMKLNRSDIVQVKCFLQPMENVATAKQAIDTFFADDPIPPVSYVEWIAGGSRPIEIEVVAAAPESDTTETVSYYTPPEMKASPVFSRVTRIHGNRRIYAAGIYSSEPDNGDDQVHSVFQKLIRLLKPGRSNLRHLAKATYYVSDADVSSRLNQIRPHYYDPKRPPAASKAMVRGVGESDRSITIDMISAPEAPLNWVLVPVAEKLKPTRSVVYKTIGDRKLRMHLFEPEGHQPTDRRPVFLAIHGGGWTGGNAPSFFPFAEHFARQGMLGISLEYRLKRDKDGTTVFDCVRDARSAVRWIRSHADELGIDPQKIIAMGGSAGGHLALSTALFDSVDEEGENQTVSARPNALILMYPVIDTSAEGYGQQKIGERWQELSPVHNVRAGLPPALIFHGTGDDVTPFPAAQQFHEQSVAAGNVSQLIVQPAGRHGYIIFARHEYDRALMQMQEFLSQQGYRFGK